ncbi:MAG: cyclic nucleotide-binding domain-containing protein [Gallionella sp.]
MNRTELLHDVQLGDLATAMLFMDARMIPDERVLVALKNSRLVENLREFEVNILASLFTVKYFEAKELTAELDDDNLKDALMILVEGDIEVNALIGSESVSLCLKSPGDLARIVSFVGADTMNISSTIRVKKNSAVLLLRRSRLETLLHSHPAIVYCVMRNLVRHVHGVVRRKHSENAEMSNYIYSRNGRY